MHINAAVGRDCKNEQADAKLVQAALNLVKSDKFALEQKLTVDGKVGKGTIAAIELFQANVVGMQKPDGIVSPNGGTIRTLKSKLTVGLSADAFAAIMAYGSKAVLDQYFPLLQTLLPQYEINTPLRTAHFLAQVGHESLSLKFTEELASGEDYEGRKDLGNTEAGDGKRFKGRGFIQLTGRSNYKAYSDDAGLKLLDKGNEVLVAKVPTHALGVSLWFWQRNNLNRHADKDDLRAVTKRINGGYNGLADREKYLLRAKFFLIQ